MQHWQNLTDVPRGIGPTVVTIGVFDGVHRGHQRVIGRAVELAHERGALAVVVTFDPHPMSVVRPDSVPPLLATLDRRIELFDDHGVDAVLVVRFDRQRSQQPAEEFVRELVGALRPVAIVVGEDFRFGFKATGDVRLLRRLGGELGFDVEGLERRRDATAEDPAAPSSIVTPTELVSSSAVRAALERGDVAAARELLGHAFRVDGAVVEGAHRGRELGIPTANVPAEPGMAVPADGVYAGWLIRHDGDEGDPQPVVISVGTLDHFAQERYGVPLRRVEAHVLDRDDLELYGLPVSIEFVARIRGQERFDSVQDLIDQEHRDVERTREILAQA